uniref:Mot1 central domain-containing protein n=1 Tax=Anopheles maculatus TaxID=74869 RepID=A0A182SC65_9DIPT
MEPMSILVPRLWPFLSHCSSSVRRSTLQTLKTLTTASTEAKAKEAAGTNGGSSTPSPSSNGKSDEATKSAVLTVPDTEEAKLGLNFGVKDWPPPLLQEALRHIFQRVLVEHVEDIQSLAEDVWNNLVVNAELSALLHASCPYVSSWLCLAMQPVRLAFDPGSLINAKPIQHPSGGNRERRPRQFDSFVDTGGGGGAAAGHLSSCSASGSLHQKLFLGGAETVPLDVREKNVVRARCKAARMIGLLSRYLVLPAPGVIYTPETESPIDCYTKVLIGYLQSRSALQRLISSLVIAYWCSFDATIQPGPPVLQERLRACLNEYVYYDEVGILFTRLLQECRDYMATLKQHKVQLAEYEQLKVLTLDQIYQIAIAYGWSAEEMRTKHCLKTKVTARTPCPNSKIVTNLCTLLKSDPEFTPRVLCPDQELAHFDATVTDDSNPYHGILTLSKQHQRCKENGGGTSGGGAGGSSGGSARGPGRPAAAASTTIAAALDLSASSSSTNSTNAALDELLGPSESEETQRKHARTQRLGATAAITTICAQFGSQLPQKLPILWQLLLDKIQYRVDEPYIDRIALDVIAQDETNDFMTSLQLLEVSAPYLNVSLHKQLFELLPKLCLLLRHPLKGVRHMVGRCLATLAAVDAAT